MLRFFRQLRVRLLTENKIRKYLLYAVGEIVLVVIGILIALQVNNYNETDKEREIYVSYLVRLKEDFLELQETVKLKRQFEADLIDLAKYQLAVLTGKETQPNLLKLAISLE
ncbi:DUF6090 family protein [Muriicola sp.]|uniref:DUF6090 family protein n=1 Tax=Muriicola sp. TaxID=2020856 RepID=UPI003C72BBD1